MAERYSGPFSDARRKYDEQYNALESAARRKNVLRFRLPPEISPPENINVFARTNRVRPLSEVPWQAEAAPEPIPTVFSAAVADGSQVLPDVGAKVGGNEQAARAGTVSSAPTTVQPVGEDYDARMASAPAVPAMTFGSPGMSMSVLPGKYGDSASALKSLRPNQGSGRPRPLLDIIPKTASEAEGIANAQKYLDEKYGNTEGNEWQDVENWKAERRKADDASRAEALAPLQYETKKRALEAQIDDPYQTREFNEALKAIPPSYLAGKVAKYRVELQRLKAPIPSDAELSDMAKMDWLEEMGIFKRNKAGRYEPEPPPDPFGMMAAKG